MGHLKIPTRRLLLGTLTSRDLAEWQAYYSIEPFGDTLLDYHLAQIAWMQCADSKHALDEFRLHGRDAEPASDADIGLKLEAMANSMPAGPS